MDLIRTNTIFRLRPVLRKVVSTSAAMCLFSAAIASAASGPCDLSPSDPAVNQADVNAAIGMTIGQQPCTANINGQGVCTVVTVQRVVNAALGGPCVTDIRTVTLNWVASVTPGVVGYNVYRSTTSGGPYTKINSSNVAATTYADQAVSPGQTYYYVVRSIGNTGLESVNSNQAIAVVPSL